MHTEGVTLGFPPFMNVHTPQSCCVVSDKSVVLTVLVRHVALGAEVKVVALAALPPDPCYTINTAVVTRHTPALCSCTEEH